MNSEQKIIELEKRIEILEKQVAAATATNFNPREVFEMLANDSKGKKRIRGTVNYS